MSGSPVAPHSFKKKKKKKVIKISLRSHEINMKINKISTYKLSIKIESKKQAT